MIQRRVDVNKYLLKKRRMIEHEVIENIVDEGADVHPEYSDLLENSPISLALKFVKLLQPLSFCQNQFLILTDLTFQLSRRRTY